MTREELQTKLIELCISDRYYNICKCERTTKVRNDLFKEILDAFDAKGKKESEGE